MQLCTGPHSEQLEAAAVGITRRSSMFDVNRVCIHVLDSNILNWLQIYDGAKPINSCHRFDSELIPFKQIFDKEVKLVSVWEGHGNAMCSHVNYECFS